MKNTIAFQHRILVVPSIGVDNRNMAMNVQAELMHFGFMLNEDALKQLGYADAADIKDFSNEIISYLKKITGGERNYKPIYPGFPEQVMEMSERELWINQLIGYWSGGSFTANEWTKSMPTAFEHVTYKMISAGTEKDFLNIFKVLSSAGTSLTPTDSKTLKWFINNYENLEFPEVIPFKENLCALIGELIISKRSLENVKLPKLTTTDVLRIIVHLSGGDISLPAVPKARIKQSRWSSYTVPNPERVAFKFKKFKRPERKKILNLIENCNLDVKEMKLKDQRWIRIGEILHPGEYAAYFPRTFKAFDKLRNENIRSWYSDVQVAFDSDFKLGLAKLSERPGEFLRRLDWLLRSNEKKIHEIFNAFSKVAKFASNKVLFELYTHFEKRRNTFNRSIMIKGARKATKLSNLPPMSSIMVDAVQEMIIEAFKSKLYDLPTMGDCWIDEELKKIPLPTNMRSLNESLIPVIRGQRTKIPGEKAYLRPFIHWYDENGRLDIDLHGYLFGKNVVTSFGYNGIHKSEFGCYSGDVRNRRGACAEYVDINIAKASKAGFRYLLMIAHNFNGGKLSDIKECVAGVMERDSSIADRSWRPDTITNSMLLNSSARMTMMGVYDLFTREYIHLDLDFGGFEQYVNGGNAGEFFEALKPYIELPKLSVYDLLSWHVEARGRSVSKETAETHFTFEDFSSSYVKTLEFLGV